MKIVVTDCKRNELIKVKVELNVNMYIVVPEILDERFNYLRQRLMNIRKKYMNLYLKDKNNYKQIENQVYNEMKETLIKEMENKHRNEGIMYYTR